MNLSFNNKGIFRFVAYFFAAYIFFYIFFHQKKIERSALTSFHTTVNSMLKNVFDDTYFLAEPMINTSTQLQYQGVLIKVDNSENYPLYDTRINLINEKILSQQVIETKKTGVNTIALQMHSYKFSFWSFVLLPFTLLISLLFAHAMVFNYSKRSMIISMAFLIAMIFIQFVMVLISMRSQAGNLETFELPMFLLNSFRKLSNLFHIEFTYVSVMTIYLFLHWKMIFLKTE